MLQEVCIVSILLLTKIPVREYHSEAITTLNIEQHIEYQFIWTIHVIITDVNNIP
jgi:hypothetical protein